MRNKALFLFIFLLSLIVSCSSEDFTLSSVSLSRNIDMTGDVKKEEAVLSFDIVSNESSETGYTFLLVSPSGDLRWEGGVTKSGEKCSLDTLSITPGASFEEGIYTLYVYSSSGSEGEKEIEIAREEGNYTYENALTKNSASIRYYNSLSMEVDDASDADWALIEYSDRYSNKVKFIAVLNQ